MGLNIKNERVCRLAREAARVTGKTQTSAIEAALELLLAEYGPDAEERRVQAKLDVIHRICVEYAQLPNDTDAEIRTAEDLFDAQTGLPV